MQLSELSIRDFLLDSLCLLHGPTTLCEASNNRTVELEDAPTGSWASERWCAGVLLCWCAVVLVCWCVGVLVCWAGDSLACWAVTCWSLVDGTSLFSFVRCWLTAQNFQTIQRLKGTLFINGPDHDVMLIQFCALRSK